MSKSSIVLTIIAGAVIGGIIAIVLKTEDALFSEDSEKETYTDQTNSRVQKIAQQFSERISSELETAEHKIKSAFKKDSVIADLSGERGLFL